MLKLFAVLLGGRAQGCTMELHDVVFVAGDSLQATYTQLINQWFGISKDLHIDAYIDLSQVDGHAVRLSKDQPPANQKKLFFVNMGGYRQGYFGEMHEITFFVAETSAEVKERAKKELGLSLLQAHCDDNVLIDDIFTVEKTGDYYLHVTPVAASASLPVVTEYILLDAPEIMAMV